MNLPLFFQSRDANLTSGTTTGVATVGAAAGAEGVRVAVGSAPSDASSAIRRSQEPGKQGGVACGGAGAAAGGSCKSGGCLVECLQADYDVAE